MSTKKGGGKPKTDFYWALCKEVFTEHEEYSLVFAPVSSDAALKKKWTNKIKNRINRYERLNLFGLDAVVLTWRCWPSMTATVNKARSTLGSTGEGLKTEDDISDALSVEFRNKWGMLMLLNGHGNGSTTLTNFPIDQVKSTCPYFFKLRDLIAQRPKDKPVGLGNSTSTIDSLVVLGGDARRSKAWGEVDFEEGSGDGERSKELDESLGDEGEEEKEKEDGGGVEEESSDKDRSKVSGKKRKSHTDDCDVEASITSKKPKTPARPNTSTPTAVPQSKNKKFKGALEFEELAKAEETTKQKELDVEKEKIRYSTAKMKAKMELKLQRDRLKFELHCRKLEQRKDLSLETLRMRQNTLSPFSMPASPAFGESMLFATANSSGSGSNLRAHSVAPAFDNTTFAPFDNAFNAFTGPIPDPLRVNNDEASSTSTPGGSGSEYTFGMGQASESE